MLDGGLVHQDTGFSRVRNRFLPGVWINGWGRPMESPRTASASRLGLIWALLVFTAIFGVVGERACGQWVQTHKIIADDADWNNTFGFSVSISGDVAIVGAINDYGGSTYVFDAATGEQVHKLIADDVVSQDNFGYSVSISGDIAIVGARYDDDAGFNSGGAYLFNVTTGAQLHKLTAADGAALDNFGNSVSISGDAAIVGAHADDDAGEYSGSAYVFDATTGEQLHKLTADDASASDWFGRSVSISGNIAIIGSLRDNHAGGYDAGSAYIYDTTTGAQLRKLTAEDAAAWDIFGTSVSISGDIAIIGASGDDDGGDSSGSAYLFNVTTGEQLHKLTADDTAALDYFGGSVSISGDVAIIGAPGDVYETDILGSVYLFDVTTGEQLQKLTADDAAVDDWFGYSVSISGDIAVVGAAMDDDGGDGSGSAYLFAGDIQFDPPIDVATIGEPTAVSTVDFTGSNGNDIAITELGETPEENGRLLVLVNDDGSGISYTEAETPVGLAPSAVAIGEFDGINGPDAAVCNAGDNNVMILLNDGAGTGYFLADPDTVDVGANPSAIAAGDFDDDDDIDLAVTNKDDDTVTILVNNGSGVFTAAPTPIGVGDAPVSIAAAKFNPGASLDLAVSNEGDDNVMILVNDGSGGFAMGETIDVGPDPGMLDPEDLNHDDDIDLVVINKGAASMSVLVRNDTGSFDRTDLAVGEDPSSLDVSDLNDDGNPDIIVVAGPEESRAIRVFRNDITPSDDLVFTHVADLAKDPNLRLTTAEDLSGDDLPDIVAVNRADDGGPKWLGGRADGSVSVLLNISPPPITPPCPGDITGPDGIPDGTVDVQDLLLVLAQWGTAGPEGDITGADGVPDGIVDVSDLLAILAAWGPC